MRTADIVRRAGKNLRQAKGRTLLTSLAIGVGAFTIALALAAGNGGRAYMDNVVSAAGNVRNINVVAKQEVQESTDAPRKVGEEVSTASSYKELTPADRVKIENIADVAKVQPNFGVSVESVSAEGGDEYHADIEVQSDGSSIELTAGQLGEDYEIRAGEIVLPHIYLGPFGFQTANDALGKTVNATFDRADGESFTRQFKIVAVDKTPTSPLAYYTNQFRISNQDGEEISQKQRPVGAPAGYYSFMVTVKEGANVDTVKQAIVDTGAYEAQTFAEMRSAIMQMVTIVQYGLMGFGLLAIIASVFGIINTQYISVLERTQQIGLMKALGARGRDVSKLFRYEAAWIGFLGGLIGVVLAWLVTLLNPVVASVLELEAGTRLLQMDWLMSAVLIGGLMVVAIASGWFPARKAARLDPIEALRTE